MKSKISTHVKCFESFLNSLSKQTHYLEHVLVLAGVHLLAEGDVVPHRHVLDPGLLRHVRHGAAGLHPALSLHQSQLSIETADQSQRSIITCTISPSIADSSEDLPLPILPTTATSSPLRMLRFKLFRMLLLSSLDQLKYAFENVTGSVAAEKSCW